MAGINAPVQGNIIEWLETAAAAAPNKDVVKRCLAAIKDQDRLINFIHRFLLFNDALAARVPYLAGLLHLRQGLFVAPGTGIAFSRVRNGLVAAYVAAAANDEYEMVDGKNLVHQHLSQVFFEGVLEYYGLSSAQTNIVREITPKLAHILDQARTRFFNQPDVDDVLAALGFHLALEFFAHQEFNEVNDWLKSEHAALVHWLIHEASGENSYLWMATHTVVEINHYNAGLEAVKEAMRYCTLSDAQIRVARCIKIGFESFLQLQRDYYEAILADYE